MKTHVFLMLIILAVPMPAFGYVDPGTGTLVFQLVVAFFVGIFFQLGRIFQIGKVRETGEEDSKHHGTGESIQSKS